MDMKERVLNTLKIGFQQRKTEQRKLHLLEMPPFTAWTSLELYDQPGECEFLSSPTLILATWRFEVDAEKFRDPVTRLRYPTVVEPTIEVSATSLDRSAMERMLSALSDLHIEALQPGRSLTLDGTIYELTVNCGSGTSSHRWREDCDAEWKPIQKWAQHWIAGLRQLANEM